MNFYGKKALIMGLGLHGGGLESARFLLKRGAEITVTDLRDEKTLRPSIDKLNILCRELGSPDVRYVIGKHEIDDFKNADVVIKNPGVRPDSPFLQAAKCIETDISLFLAENTARLFAVTGTKGKSGTAAALYHILSCFIERKEREGKREKGKGNLIRNVYLGGNITVSPLKFLDELTACDDVVLELSSFQLGDLKGRVKDDGAPLLKPQAAVITAIMADHLDRYASMEEYVNDKRVIYQGQDSSCVTVAYDDEWGKSFLAETKARPIQCTMHNAQCTINSEQLLLPEKLLVPGRHQRVNLLAAALAVYYAEGEGDDVAQSIRGALSTYKGIEHRLEFFHEKDGVRFYNDSAATIPEAAAACIEALTEDTAEAAPLVLVTGGTDKNLDFTPLAKAAHKAAAVILLAGTGSDKLAPLLAENGIAYDGPFNDLKAAVDCVFNKIKDTKNKISSPATCYLLPATYIDVVLSPGCASFGMFLNEFDRGRRWKEEILSTNYTN